MRILTAVLACCSPSDSRKRRLLLHSTCQVCFVVALIAVSLSFSPITSTRPIMKAMEEPVAFRAKATGRPSGNPLRSPPFDPYAW